MPRSSRIAIAVLAVVAMLSSGCRIVLGIEEPNLVLEDASVARDASVASDGALADRRGDVSLSIDVSVARVDARAEDVASDGATLDRGEIVANPTCGPDTKRCGTQCVAVDDATYGCGLTTCDTTTCPEAGAGALVCQGGACVIGECGDGTKKCGDACVAIDNPTYGCGPVACAPCAAVPGAALVCRGGACAIGTCAAGAKKCGDACVAINDVNYGCGAATCDKATCPSVGAGTLACQGGACVIGTCGAGTKNCAGKCVAIDDPTYGCGATTCDATACPAPGVGTLVCSGGACTIGSCGAGSKKCGTRCVPLDVNNGCADAARCTPCAATETCVGAPSQCACVANNDACTGKDCGLVVNNCGQMVSCGTCTALRTCGGGGVANRCGCTPVNPCAGGRCGAGLADGCGGTVSCTCSGTNSSCGGGGTAGVCGCTKKTCAGLCGAQADGCGGTLQCPACCVPKTTCTTGQCGPVADGCGGTIGCPACTGVGQTCGGGGTANVCGCIDNNTAACTGKPCQLVTNNCGKAVTCPNACPVRPELVSSCQSGQCAYGCPAGAAPLSCSSSSVPACGVWRFETAGATAGWSVEPTLDPNAWTGTPISVTNGALAIPYAVTQEGPATWLLVRMNLCPGGQIQELRGKRVTARVRVDATLPVGDNSGSYLQMYPTTAPTRRLADQDSFAFNQWYTMQGDVVQLTQSASIDFAFLIYIPARGMMYIDDVTIVPTP